MGPKAPLMDQASRKSGGESAPRRGGNVPGSVSLGGAFFGEGLEAHEARSFALALEALGFRVHLKPRWFEEAGVERSDRGAGGDDHRSY